MPDNLVSKNCTILLYLVQSLGLNYFRRIRYYVSN